MWLHASILKFYSIQCMYIWICILCSQFAKASPLLNTDDTEITSYGHCQLESAIVPSKNAGTSYQLNPACQLVKGIESGVGYNQNNLDSNSYGVSAQLKTVIKALDTWGVAGSLSVSENKTAIGDSVDWFLNMPFAWVLADTPIHLYTNVGYQYSKQHADLVKWSAAASYQLNSKASITLEAFNQDQKSPFFQSVFQYSIIPDLLTFEASFGQRMEAFRQRWFGFGLSFTP